MHVAKKLSGCAKLTLALKDIDFVHRVQAKRPVQENRRAIIVCFNNIN